MWTPIVWKGTYSLDVVVTTFLLLGEWDIYGWSQVSGENRTTFAGNELGILGVWGASHLWAGTLAPVAEPPLVCPSWEYKSLQTLRWLRFDWSSSSYLVEGTREAGKPACVCSMCTDKLVCCVCVCMDAHGKHTHSSVSVTCFVLFVLLLKLLSKYKIQLRRAQLIENKEFWEIDISCRCCWSTRPI